MVIELRCDDCGHRYIKGGDHDCLRDPEPALGLQWIETTLPPPFEDEDED